MGVTSFLKLPVRMTIALPCIGSCPTEPARRCHKVTSMRLRSHYFEAIADAAPCSTSVRRAAHSWGATSPSPPWGASPAGRGPRCSSQHPSPAHGGGTCMSVLRRGTVRPGLGKRPAPHIKGRLSGSGARWQARHSNVQTCTAACFWLAGPACSRRQDPSGRAHLPAGTRCRRAAPAPLHQSHPPSAGRHPLAAPRPGAAAARGCTQRQRAGRGRSGSWLRRRRRRPTKRGLGSGRGWQRGRQLPPGGAAPPRPPTPEWQPWRASCMREGSMKRVLGAGCLKKAGTWSGAGMWRGLPRNNSWSSQAALQRCCCMQAACPHTNTRSHLRGNR